MNAKHLAAIGGGAAIVAAIAIALSISAQPTNTDSVGSNVDMLGDGKDVSKVQTAAVEYVDGANGFLARPEAPGKYPGVVMIHEWWGLNDNMKEMATQMASEGYVVLAADLYNGQVASESSQAQPLAAQVRGNPDAAVQNLKGAVGYLRGHDSVDASSIGALGWCFGGGFSLQLALNEQLNATGIYYGSLVTEPQTLSVIEWPVLGVFGSADRSISVEQVRGFEAALDQNGIENEIYVYEGVGHAFANPSGASYAPEETADAWNKTLSFFDRHLKQT
jgi:carboxymethylenebutenolidase